MSIIINKNKNMNKKKILEIIEFRLNNDISNLKVFFFLIIYFYKKNFLLI